MRKSPVCHVACTSDVSNLRYLASIPEHATSAKLYSALNNKSDGRKSMSAMFMSQHIMYQNVFCDS